MLTLEAIGLLSVVFFALFLRRMAILAGNNKQHVHVRVFLAVYIGVAITFTVIYWLPESWLEIGSLHYQIGPAVMAVFFAWFAVLAGSIRAAVTRMLVVE